MTENVTTVCTMDADGNWYAMSATWMMRAMSMTMRCPKTSPMTSPAAMALTPIRRLSSTIERATWRLVMPMVRRAPYRRRLRFRKALSESPRNPREYTAMKAMARRMMPCTLSLCASCGWFMLAEKTKKTTIENTLLSQNAT